MKLLQLLLLAVVCLSLGATAQIPPSHFPANVAALMNFSADPCQEFYEYACGGWLANVTLPPSEPIVEHAITLIETNNQLILEAIIQNASTPAKYPKITEFYQLCMDRQTINGLGTVPLQPWSRAVEVETLSDFFELIAFWHTFQIPGLFQFSVVADPGNPYINIVEFDQGGYTLPSRDMYIAHDAPSKQLLLDYTAHVATMFQLFGDLNYSARAEEVVALETLIAQANLPIDEIRDPLSVYHRMNVSELVALTPSLPWLSYLNLIDSVNSSAANITQINVAEPAFFQALEPILTSQTAHALESYLLWQLIHAVADYLPDPFVNATFAFFGTELNGQSAPTPLSSTCIQATDAALGNILGQAFVDAAFGGNSQQIVTEMIASIKAAFHSVLLASTWMDDATRTAALVKLSEVTDRVGSPQNPSYYPGYDISESQYLQSTLFKLSYDFVGMVSQIGLPPNRNQWQMTADTVNAYYNPPDNSINFPAGIMQDPYFLAGRNAAQNYGGVGVIMGHELTHGFDDQGRMYDGHGKLVNWWSNASAAHFEASTACMANQYSQFEVLPGLYVDGNQTLGENIADNGGVKNAYTAYTTLYGGSADLPLFFVGYAQGWCAKATPDYEKVEIQSDVHSPPKFRVIGPLQNFLPFSSTFSCPVGSYMNPTVKCQVW